MPDGTRKRGGVPISAKTAGMPVIEPRGFVAGLDCARAVLNLTAVRSPTMYKCCYLLVWCEDAGCWWQADECEERSLGPPSPC